MKLSEHFVLSAHAKENARDRKIKYGWIQSALNTPDIKQYRKDGKVHYLRRIQEHGGYCLRVIVDPRKEPRVVVTVYFDSSVF